jgi:citrate lyase beta subunit
LNSVAAISSILFVPGSRPDRFAKALATNADLICIDLEDAVPSTAKAEARRHAIEALNGGDTRIALRINAIATEDGMRDLLALKESGAAPTLFLPMVESARDVAIVAGALAAADLAIVPLVESAAALRAAHDIAGAPQVAAMMFGGGDLSAELGVELAWEPLAAARAHFVLASAGRGLGIIDVPFVRLDDTAGLEEESARARALGFTAKAAIHPAQVEPIRRAFRPSGSEIEEARDALKAFHAGGGRAVRHQGRMLEAPVMRRYQAILAGRETPDA